LTVWLHKAKDTGTLKALMPMIVSVLLIVLLPNPQKVVEVLQSPIKSINLRISLMQNQEVLCTADI